MSAALSLVVPEPRALPSILFVDDEESVLSAINRMLHGRYRITLANGADEALQLLEMQTFDVIVSDMRMPGMGGHELLRRAAFRCPDMQRLVLSGQADVEAAAAAINEGRIFRFLVKPVKKDLLTTALDAALEQRRLLRSEKELLEQTLTGAVDALCETLSLANPEAFGRSRTLKRIASLLATELQLPGRWQVEVAAALSQLSAVSLPHSLIEHQRTGVMLTADERSMVRQGQKLSFQILNRVPRLGPVADLIDEMSQGRASTLEQWILLVANEVETGLARGEDIEALTAALESRGTVPSTLLLAVRKLKTLLCGDGTERSVAVTGLQVDMVLLEDVLTASGALLIGQGHQLTDSVLLRLKNFAKTVGIREPIRVFVPFQA